MQGSDLRNIVCIVPHPAGKGSQEVERDSQTPADARMEFCAARWAAKSLLSSSVSVTLLTEKNRICQTSSQLIFRSCLISRLLSIVIEDLLVALVDQGCQVLVEERAALHRR